MSWSGEPRPVILTKYSGRLPPGRYSRAAALAEIEWIQTEKIDPLESQLKKRLDGRTRRGTETRHDRWEDELSHIHAAVSKPLIGSAYNGTAATSDGTKPCGRIGCLNIISEF